MMKSYELVLSEQTIANIKAYQNQLSVEPGSAGERLKTVADSTKALSMIDCNAFVRILLKTKSPQIFAESDIVGDGTDWNQTELSILGDISVSTQVRVYDNGLHSNPSIHEKPLDAYLLFVAGALLQSSGEVPCDWNEVTVGGWLDDESFFRLYERRLLPVLLHADSICEARGTKGFITVPGIGCGQFAGSFIGQLGHKLNSVLKRLLSENHSRLTFIQAVYFDPYEECANEHLLFGSITYYVRPLVQGNELKSQLCSPAELQNPGDNYDDCLLLSVVAWDHVSWPGNDFYIGARMTDDGVKAAATDLMHRITGVQGEYSAKTYRYSTPDRFQNWEEVVNHLGLEFGQSAEIYVY